MPLLALLGLALAARPTLHFDDPVVQARLGPAFEAALANVLDVNAVPCDPGRYNRTGLMTEARFLRAGGGYGQPWTRDAAVNSWNAASLLAPTLARDTLWAVTAPSPEGPTVQRDDQWWDKVVWIVGAEHHCRVTGDRAFLKTAYGTSKRLLTEMRAARFDPQTGLFQGPSFFNDGIAGYPAPPAEKDDGGSSFVLDHPGTDRLFALSTNALYVGAYRAADAMAKALGEKSTWAKRADALKAAIDRRFWMRDQGIYGYLLQEGRLDPSQEGCGLAFAVLFDVASPQRARSILRKAHLEPYGMTDVYPSFPRYSDARPGRHNAIVWPMVQGMWARAAAKARDADALARQMDALAGLATASGGFYEIYNARTGRVDGGWQNNHAWGSEKDQTWSATAYLSMVTDGLLGMRFERDRLRFEPLVPKGWGAVSLEGVPYRAATLDIRLKGEGSRMVSLRLDGKPIRAVPGRLTGRHTVDVAVR